MQLPVTPSPIQQLHDPLFIEKGIEVYLKRDDLIHPHIQGNKWRKLKYNLLEARLNGQHTLLTFGGPYSNHIYATAAAARLFHFRSIGIIRGEEPMSQSATLQFAASQGMELYYMDRMSYREKDDPANIESLHVQIGEFYHIPEGGTNLIALEGAAETVTEIDFPFDYLTTAVGTGGTLAGLLAGLQGRVQVLGFAALKGEDTLTPKVDRLVREYTGETFANFNICFDYHFGGYARITQPLADFIIAFNQQHEVRLEPVYTGKMMFGLYELIRQDYFGRGAVIVALHTGGLQGLCGFENYFPGWSAAYF